MPSVLVCNTWTLHAVLLYVWWMSWMLNELTSTMGRTFKTAGTLASQTASCFFLERQSTCNFYCFLRIPGRDRERWTMDTMRDENLLVIGGVDVKVMSPSFWRLRKLVDVISLQEPAFLKNIQHVHALRVEDQSKTLYWRYRLSACGNFKLSFSRL